MYACMYLFESIHACMYVLTNVRTQACASVDACMSMHEYIYIYIHTPLCVCVYIPGLQRLSIGLVPKTRLWWETTSAHEEMSTSLSHGWRELVVGSTFRTTKKR